LFLFFVLMRLGSFFGEVKPNPAPGARGVERSGGISIASSPARAKVSQPALPPLGAPLIFE
jgi:hypothetical protein